MTPDASCGSGLSESLARRRNAIVEDLSARDSRWFDTEIDKLDRWTDGRRASLMVELDELDDKIKETKKAARLAPTSPRNWSGRGSFASLRVREMRHGGLMTALGKNWRNRRTPCWTKSASVWSRTLRKSRCSRSAGT